MGGKYPVEDRVVVLKKGERLGPFDIDELLVRVESGEFDYGDVCLREGAAECERLRDILDWDEPESSAPQELPEPEPEPEPRDDGPPPCSPDAILYSGHPSILTYPFTVFCMAGGAVGGLWVYPINGWLSLLLFFVAVLALGYAGIARFTNDYLISPKRIELIRGLIVRSSNEVRIEDIRAINVKCRGLSGIVGIGSVDFFTAGDAPEVTFRNIWAAKKVKGLVRKLQDAAAAPR
ncbi:MAG: PH domain-containing protein [Verrucomicrobiales bacterium]